MAGIRLSSWYRDMRTLIAFLLPVVTCLFCFSGSQTIRAQRPTMPGGYQLPHYLQPITLTPVFRSEPLLRAAREVIGEVASVQAGETVLIVSDSSINPLLLEVFEQAILEKEAQVHVHSLPLPRASSTRTLLQKQHWRNWWPRETWNELRTCLLYTSPSPRDLSTSRMPSSA